MVEKVELGKFCPLLKENCRKGLCAWWIKDSDECTLVVLTDEINYLNKKINDFVNYSINTDRTL